MKAWLAFFLGVSTPANPTPEATGKILITPGLGRPSLESLGTTPASSTTRDRAAQWELVAFMDMIRLVEKRTLLLAYNYI